MYLLFVSLQATAVVPLPRKQSRTTSFSLEELRIRVLIMFKGLIVGMAAGAVIGIALDPLSSRDKRMMKKKVEKAIGMLK